MPQRRVILVESMSILARARGAARDALGPASLPFTVLALRRARRRVRTVDEAVALAFGRRFGWLIGPWQAPDEVRGTLHELQAKPPAAVLEIGTCKGGALMLYAQFAADAATLVSVDLPHGRFGGGYPAWRRLLYRSFTRARQRLVLVRGNSQHESTRAEVVEALGGRPVDFLFIDGDHTYDGVKRDFELYSPLVAPDGLIGFHDIVPGAGERVGGVPEFWQELKSSGRYDVRELVVDWSAGSGGVGLIALEPRQGFAT